MGFQYVDYETLSKYIKESIATEIKSHNIDEKNLSKALRALAVGHKDRALQCRFLLTVLIGLDAYDEKEKTLILNAAVFYIRNTIRESYKKNFTSLILSPENSTLYNALTTSLNLTLDNLPESGDVHEMYLVLRDFMYARVYENGFLDVNKSIFKKIMSYIVETVLQDLIRKIAGFELNNLSHSRDPQSSKDNGSKSKSHTRLGIFSASDQARFSSTDDCIEEISSQCS